MTVYGVPAGLPKRLQYWRDTLCTNRSLPWLGTGLVKDLEIAVQLLNMKEFADWLRTSGDPAHAQFATELIDTQVVLDNAGYRTPSLFANVDGLDDENRENDAKALVLRDVRQVLVDSGALAPNDQDTPLPDLLRMLLS